MEKGIINSIEGNKVHITMRKEIACCGQSCNGDSCSVETFDFKAVNKNNLDLKVGQTVEFTIPAGSTLRGLLLVFVIPFGLFFGLYGAAPLLGITTSGGQLGLAFAGLTLSWLLGRLAPKESKEPVIVGTV